MVCFLDSSSISPPRMLNFSRTVCFEQQGPNKQQTNRLLLVHDADFEMRFRDDSLKGVSLPSVLSVGTV